jgi:hypothetical protein
MGSAVAWTSRLVSYGNAFLSYRHDAGRRTTRAISGEVRRWRFDTLVARPWAIMPLRMVARNPYGWFKWLRRSGYHNLVLLRLSRAEVASLSGPLDAFSASGPGWFIAAEGRGRVMLWDEWKSGASGMFGSGPFGVEFRGAEVDRLTRPASSDAGELIARLDAALAAAAALTPADAEGFERAREALNAPIPEAVAAHSGLPLLPPVADSLAARQLAAAVQIVWACERPFSPWDGPPERPPGFNVAITDAVLRAVNGA